MLTCGNINSKECTITKGVVDGTEKPVLTHRDPQEVTRKAKGRSKARTGGEDV